MQKVPKALKVWFVIHFVLDVLFAIPLMIAPKASLALMGWNTFDPLTTRLVAAALLGIGIESFLGRNSGKESYIGMLNLKIIWSAAAIVAIVKTICCPNIEAPIGLVAILGGFILFNFNWIYWRLQLNK
ncbi:hypothetical protein HN709_04235 [Candidatus Peregrinibacteria bacterium]|jgi:hypothetical protein|nr:hypothetical protein [Candidatus Peregrinibacteria bacterium]MBT7736872.1 hypothetical protein [Candidatus Peregrinibacteria bacterium]